MNESTFSLAQIWAQGDAVSHFIAIVLLVLSVASWAVILGKGWKLWRLRHAAPVAIDSFWHASTAVVSVMRSMASLLGRETSPSRFRRRGST